MRIHVFIQLVAQVGAVVALTRRGLGSVHRALILYLIGSFIQGSVLLCFEQGTQGYLTAWLFSLPFIMALQVATAAEAYQRSLEEIPGAGRSSHYVIWSLSLLGAAWAQAGQQTYSSLGVLSRAGQAVTMVLAISAIGIAALVGMLRPLRRRNVIWHERLLALHFTFCAVLWFYYHRGQIGWTGMMNVWVSIGVCFAWALVLRPEGEVFRKGPPPSSDDQRRAAQMTPLSDSVVDTVRKIFG